MPPKNSSKVVPDGDADVEAGGIDNPAIDIAAFSVPEKSQIDDTTAGFQADGIDDTKTAEKTDLETIDRSKPYAGMGKEDLLRFSDTEFWNRFRLISIIVFWGAFLVLLGTVIGLTIVAPRCGERPTPEWWQKSVIYQIYVRSFYDSNNDGKGDIQGIIQKLDHLVDLNVNAILLSSMYKSSSSNNGLPDHGYEVTNHTDIDDYGGMAALDKLIEAAHNKSIAVIMDFIPNHTGTDHEWFTMSRQDRNYTNPYWNYYVWANCPSGGVNNWMSVYGDQEAWSQDADQPDQCYLHQFLDSQPELNLRSAAVQSELENILRFWLEKGVNGFRINSAAYLFENTDLNDEKVIPDCNQNTYDCHYHTATKSLPEVYDMMERWREIMDEYTEKDSNKSNPLRTRILLSDGDVDMTESRKYYGGRGDGANLPINYLLSHFNSSCDGSCISNRVRQWISSLPEGATTAWLVGDQDRSRMKSLHETYSNAVMLLKMTLPGTTLIYYGEEIGMTNFADVISDPQDPLGNFSISRDAYRTPMQWGNGTNGDFSNATGTWLPVNRNSATVNVAYPDAVTSSTLNLVKQLAKLRAEQDSLQYGKMHFVNVTDVNIMAFVREHEGFDRLLVVINFGKKPADVVDITTDKSSISLPSAAEVILRTNWNTTSINPGNNENLKRVMLEPGEGFIAKWEYARP